MPPRTREAIFSGFQNSHGKSRSTSPLSLSRVKEELSSRGRKPHPKGPPPPTGRGSLACFGVMLATLHTLFHLQGNWGWSRSGRRSESPRLLCAPPSCRPCFSEGIALQFHGLGSFAAVAGHSLSHVSFFVTPWTAAHQASLSFTEFLRVPQGCSENPVPCLWAPTLGLALLRSSLSSVRFSGSVVSDSLWPHGLQHARPPCPLPTPGACSSSCPSSQWCHLTISPSVIPFSSHLHSFQASGSFPMCWLFVSGGQSTGASSSASVLQMNIRGWLPVGLTGLISLLFKELSTVFSSTTVQRPSIFWHSVLQFSQEAGRVVW